ncbi:hypothetical protein IPJ72_02490 [Candidatus Peregrinibacteria bacterium]|nr:MAG: hypothetical protein IPJ72_02490 [Candidatus Peregrinibacteria bacterium]
MYKMRFLVVAITMLALAGCGKATPVAQDYSDLTACGDFTTSSGDGGPTSRYFVCRDANNGQCYYKKTYFEQIPGCDPESDKNPYGKEECFENKTALYSFNSATSQSTTNSNDSCAATTQTYFESKVSE